jgi:hypothetical protein
MNMDISITDSVDNEVEEKQLLLQHLRHLEETGALTPVSLTLPDAIPYERWEALVAFFGKVKRATPWWIGDVLVYGEHWYGELYSQAADVFHLGQDTVEN